MEREFTVDCMEENSTTKTTASTGSAPMVISEPNTHAVCPSKRTLASPMWLKRPAAMREFAVAQYTSVDISKKRVRRTGPTPGRGDGRFRVGPRASTGAVVVTKGFETTTPWRGGAQCGAVNGDRDEARVASLREERKGDGTGSEGTLDGGAVAVGGTSLRSEPHFQH